MNLKNFKTYPVKNLYIGALGYVTYNSKKENYYIKEVDKFILYMKKPYKIPGYYTSNGDFVGKCIFSKKEYFFWEGNRYDEETIYKAVNNYAILRSIPLAPFLLKSTIKHKELIDFYNGLKQKLNKKEVMDMQEEIDTPEEITDTILQTILETNEMVKEASIDDELKQSIVNDLKELGEYYVNVMTNNYQINNNDLTLEDNYSVRMYVIRKLAEIETKLKSPELVQVHSLKNQYKVFQKKLKISNK